jgi:hypothetical protein
MALTSHADRPEALQELLTMLRLSDLEDQSLEIRGEDPIVRSPHRLGSQRLRRWRRRVRRLRLFGDCEAAVVSESRSTFVTRFMR